MISRPFTRRFSYSAGPQALAVLSCALALLAVNPTALRAAQSDPAPLTRVQSTLSDTTSVIVETTPVGMTSSLTPWRPDTRKSKLSTKTTIAQHTSVLQTVAYLNAVLISHFVPLLPQAVAPIHINVLTMQSLTLPELPLTSNINPLPQPHEQTFALTHCLLAPPV